MATTYLLSFYFHNFDRERLGEPDVHILYINFRWLSGIFQIILSTLLANYVRLTIDETPLLPELDSYAVDMLKRLI
jgi:hypothetical protein